MASFWEKVNRKIDFILYKRTLFDKEFSRTYNIFDYNNVVRRRPSAYIENCSANVMYSMGYSLRKYSGYEGRVYVGTEHAMPSLRTNNVEEFRDIDAPIVFLSSDDRRSVVAPLTDKLLFHFGPNFAPYVGDGIYSDFAIEQIKKVIGKTIVVFPQHNTDVHAYVGFMESAKKEIDYVNKLKEEHGYDTVIACLYHVDVTRGMAKMYEDQGWVVISSGHHHNYDFGKCQKTIFDLADLTITQGITGVAYSLYWGKPCIYYKAVEEFTLAGGNGEINEEHKWVVPIRRELEQLFGEYTDVITPEQREYANRRWGLEQTQSPEQMRALLEFAKEIRKCYKNDKKVLKIASKPKYACIKSQVEESLQLRKDNYHV